jgi:hypothetical protein
VRLYSANCRYLRKRFCELGGKSVDMPSSGVMCWVKHYSQARKLHRLQFQCTDDSAEQLFSHKDRKDSCLTCKCCYVCLLCHDTSVLAEFEMPHLYGMGVSIRRLNCEVTGTFILTVTERLLSSTGLQIHLFPLFIFHSNTPFPSLMFC